jgi:hypothetical protein
VGSSELEAKTDTVEEVGDIGDKGITGDLTNTGKVVVDDPWSPAAGEEGNAGEGAGRSSVVGVDVEETPAKTAGGTV